MTPQIDFYWDIGSTNTYFALHLIRPIATHYGARIVPHPFNLGHVFRQHSYVLMQEPRAKLHHRRVDLHRWAVRHQLPFRMPDEFPIKTSRALRGALAMRRFDQEWPYLEAIFRAYWERNDASIADYAGLRPIVTRLGIDADAFEQLSESVAIRAELIAETDAGLARGAFGVPTSSWADARKRSAVDARRCLGRDQRTGLALGRRDRRESTGTASSSWIAAVDELLSRNLVEDATFAALKRHFNDAQIVELFFLVGTHRMHGMPVRAPHLEFDADTTARMQEAPASEEATMKNDLAQMAGATARK